MTEACGAPVTHPVEAVRRFNRFYTQQIGVLHEGLLRSPFSLTEARVLYELANRGEPTAAEIGKDLGLDAGYLSRILRRFEQGGLIRRKISDTDARQNLLALTPLGREAFAPLNRRSREEVAAMLGKIPEGKQGRLLEAMQTIEELLGARPATKPPYLLRQHQPGDMGAVIRLHGKVYAEEYGFNQEFEALVARIAAKFLEHSDPAAERCWIAEVNGEVAGSVLLVRQSKTIAKLRLLVVDPRARGLGIGARLVNECVTFARHAGYRKVTLWTNRVLLAARHIYEQAGFRVVREERRHEFGGEQVSETWELTL